MSSPLVTLFSSEFFFYSENINAFRDPLIFNELAVHPLFLFFDSFVSLNDSVTTATVTKELINFINQIENLESFKNYENTSAVYHYSIPNVKLWYPEPFIASPSFMHSDLWFMHILLYQYWLWFVFIFIIIFFFITFISTVRWCSMRVRPRKETRGVSRSKCGDLITACVPVTWATSIIVSESTDAIDFYDGFGTTELVVGIRAYQWGWEYYYPKDVDLNYNIKNSSSSYVGNSLRYSKTTAANNSANTFWKFYQNKSTDQVVSPAHLIVIPFDDYKIFSILSFNDSGANPSLEVNAFKKTKIFSKFNKNDLNYQPYALFSNYSKLGKLYFSSSEFSESLYIGTKNQFNLLSINSYLNSQTTLLNLETIKKFYNSSLAKETSGYSKSATTSIFKFIKKNYSAGLKLFQNEIKFSQKFTPASTLKSIKELNLEQNEKTIDLIQNVNLKFFKVQNKNTQSLSNSSLLNWPVSNVNYKNSENVGLGDRIVWPLPSTNIFVSNLAPHFSNSIAVSLSKDTESQKALFNMWWRSLWSKSQLNWRISSNKVLLETTQKFYIPTISLYYDYDFRNWQFFQYLEDILWESVLSAYIGDEYDVISNEYYNDEYAEKTDIPYYKLNQIPTKAGWVINSAALLEDWVSSDLYANPILLEDNTTQFSLLTTKDFSTYSNYYMTYSIDNSYENFKNSLILQNAFGKTAINYNSSVFSVQSSALVLDSFRSDFESFAWAFDETPLTVKNSIDFKNYANFNGSEVVIDEYNDQNFLISPNKNTSIKFSNFINNRSGAKGSVLNFNAMQKVFRPRFDEGRSLAKLEDFSYSTNNQQFVSAPRVNYERIVGKTNENFFKINLFKNNFKLNYKHTYELNSSLNFFIYDFPFLLGLRSDASKYFWFDWYAKWGFYEVQPASSSKYAIFGMPYFNKPFEFQQQFSLELNESENYLTRISRARRNYVTNWTFTPYLFAKNNSWFLNNFIFEIFEDSENNTLLTQHLLEKALSHKIVNLTNFSKQEFSYHFHPSHSGASTYTRNDIRPKHSIQSYYYASSRLVDILSKREFLLRELMTASNAITALPVELTASANNPILNEVKMSFIFSDYTNITNEYSRSVYLLSTSYFNYLTFKSVLFDSSSHVNSRLLSWLATFAEPLVDNNVELYKNQYRPMRKSISNMIRLHATGAMAMPSEMRLQILASSKDVIHSWAVPSAGIKIDCVPGYSSHKVFLFLVSGIFWGQCMEICGRYHHWMPIIVYFMKRDLFFLWCTHFAYSNNYNLMLSINDRTYADYSKQVSYNKYMWLNEVI